jgi:hypothetical protein
MSAAADSDRANVTRSIMILLLFGISPALLQNLPLERIPRFC